MGAYLAEFRDGLTGDELAEALDWSLLRVERALATLDAALESSGMRLALRAARIVIVGRLGWSWVGRAESVSASPWSSPCTRRPTGTARVLATDNLLAHPLTRSLRIH